MVTVNLVCSKTEIGNFIFHLTFLLCICSQLDENRCEGQEDDSWGLWLAELKNKGNWLAWDACQMFAESTWGISAGGCMYSLVFASSWVSTRSWLRYVLSSPKLYNLTCEFRENYYWYLQVFSQAFSRDKCLYDLMDPTFLPRLTSTPYNYCCLRPLHPFQYSPSHSY